jgi:hypothetical protein
MKLPDPANRSRPRAGAGKVRCEGREFSESQVDKIGEGNESQVVFLKENGERASRMQ